MLIIAYLYDKKLPIEEFVIKGVIDFKIPEEDIATIIEDYNFIIQKIKDGKAHELSEGQTNYLGASSTGASSSDRTSQPFNELESKPRRWSFKNSYMNNIIGKYFKKKEYVSIKSNSEKSLEQYVFEKIKPFRNLTEAEIKSKLGLNYKVEAKNGIHILASGMLGIKGSSLKNLGKTEEFLKANIKLKTIRILKSMKLKEDMSFKNIKFNEISQVENFEDSEMYEVFSETRYLLFLMLEDENGEFRFNNVKFWAMNSEEIEEIKKLRIKIKKALKEGIRADTSSSRYVYENLPTSQKDSWAHIRTKGPGGEGPRNFEVLDDGSKIRKHCVFIGKSHVMKIIEDSIIIY